MTNEIANGNLEWNDYKFRDLLVENVRNGVYKRKEFHGRGVKVVNMGELFAYPRISDVEMKRVELTDRELDNFELKQGDLLFARRSLVAEGAGKCTLVQKVSEPTVFESSIIRARPDPSIANSDYLYYFFSSPQGKHQLGTILRQVAVSGITGTDLSNLTIPIPSLREQRRIAHILGTLDDKIELNRKMNETLEEIARTLFTSWFVNFDPVRAKAAGEQPFGMDEATAALFPDSFVDSELGPIPEGWRVARVDEVLRLSYGKALKESNRRPGPVPVYGSSGPVGFHDEALVQGPGIVVGRKGTAGSVVRVEEDFFPIDTTFYTTLDEKSLPSISFAVFMLRGLNLPNLGSDSAVPGLNRDTAHSQKFLLPQISLVEEFDKIVKPLYSLKKSNNDEIETLATIRDTLLPMLLSGEIRVQNGLERVKGKVHEHQERSATPS